MNHSDAIRVAAANLLDGGISQDGTAGRRDQTAAALRGWEPHLVLVQELYAPGEELVRKHFRALASAVGMDPVALGLPRGSKRLRAGILAGTRVLEILDDGPVPVRDAPFWAEAVVRIRATGTVLTVTSVHAPATNAGGQASEAGRLATRTAQRGGLNIAGGDWNCYTPDQLTDDELGQLPPHLRPARMRTAGGRLAANYDVHDTLTSVGMADPVPALPPGHRDPPDPPGTGSHLRARIDRFYLWPGTELLRAVTCYHQKPSPGSDHQMLMICLDPAALADAIPQDPGHDRRTNEGTPAVTEIDFAYFNYEHGGKPVAGGPGGGYRYSGVGTAGFHGGGHGYDFQGLIRVMSGRWPDVLILGEGDEYDVHGQEGARDAALAMREAGGRVYAPFFGSLPREDGPFAPVIFVDEQTIVVRRWFDQHAPDFSARSRNVLLAAVPGHPDEWFRIVTGHGDINDGDQQLADAKRLRRFAEPGIPCIVGMDWNSTPSGPWWADREVNDPGLWPPEKRHNLARRIIWHHGPLQDGPYEPDTRALDYLVGWWDPDKQQRTGGIGFHWVAELEKDPAPTKVPVPGRQVLALDGFIVNDPWKDRIVPGSYEVHQPADPAHPDSDHLRVSVAIQV